MFHHVSTSTIAAFSIVALCMTATFSPRPVAAASPATTRNVNNANLALGSIEVVEAFRTGPVPADQTQRAKNILRDLDSGIGRAQNALSSIGMLEKMLPEVQKVSALLESSIAYRADLQRNLGAGQQASAASTEQMRAFREDVKGQKEVLVLYTKIATDPKLQPFGTAEEIRKELVALETVDALCKGKYAGIADVKNVSFQLDTYPGTWCKTAASRQAIATRIAEATIRKEMAATLKHIDEDRTALEGRGGFASVDGPLADVLYHLPEAKTKMSAKFAPLYEILARAPSPELFTALDKAVAAWHAEVERLAPTWTWPAQSYHEKSVEGFGAKWISANFKGAKIVKTALLEDHWTISKNALGIPLDRYRTGMALYSLPAEKWCRYQQFTVVETYAGGGNFAKATGINNAGAPRSQSCK